MRQLFKLQIKDLSTNKNHVEEVIANNRITSHIDYATEKFLELKKGDIGLIHIGNSPEYLVEIIERITDKSLIKGKSFGIDYSIKKISHFNDLPDSLDFKTQNKYVGFDGTYLPLKDKTTKTYKFIESWYNFITKSSTMDNIELLKQKKQIILQGPPGTGKTRLAKQIAMEMCLPNTITTKQITETLHVDLIVKSVSNKEYQIVKIDKDSLDYVRKNTNTRAKLNFSTIQKAYEDKIWLNNKIKNGSDPYSAAFAKYIYKNLYFQNLQLIQFHPSYTYEDFVRGITVKSGENGLEYITEDKMLAKIAKEAHENYQNSQKDEVEYNKEFRTKEYFSQFVDYISDKIEENNNFFSLTDYVGIINVDETAFRYKGKNDGWAIQGNRMLFKDIIQAFLDDNTKRQDIKNNKNLSGLAKQHASYYVRVLTMFYAYLQENKLSFDYSNTTKESLKNYVLIIDEINRANLSSVLGELIYALEYRGEKVQSMYDIDGENGIIIPSNLYIIGTMNTADRSVGQIDYAIRRRFAFVDVLPKVLEESTLENGLKFNAVKFNAVKTLFEVHITGEFNIQDVQLGHSYFIHEDNKFDLKLKYEIIPILKEYVADGILKESALDTINKL